MQVERWLEPLSARDRVWKYTDEIYWWRWLYEETLGQTADYVCDPWLVEEDIDILTLGIGLESKERDFCTARNEKIDTRRSENTTNRTKQIER